MRRRRGGAGASAAGLALGLLLLLLLRSGDATLEDCAARNDTCSPTTTGTCTTSAVGCEDQCHCFTVFKDFVPTLEDHYRGRCEACCADALCYTATFPSAAPSLWPSTPPSWQPTTSPSALPTQQPSSVPSLRPSGAPSIVPSRVPTTPPSAAPTAEPSVAHSGVPSVAPSPIPSASSSSPPSAAPSKVVSHLPTTPPNLAGPTASTAPTASRAPTPAALASPVPTLAPTRPSPAGSAVPTAVGSSRAPSAPLLATAPSPIPSAVPTTIEEGGASGVATNAPTRGSGTSTGGGSSSRSSGNDETQTILFSVIPVMLMIALLAALFVVYRRRKKRRRTLQVAALDPAADRADDKLLQGAAAKAGGGDGNSLHKDNWDSDPVGGGPPRRDDEEQGLQRTSALFGFTPIDQEEGDVMGGDAQDDPHQGPLDRAPLNPLMASAGRAGTAHDGPRDSVPVPFHGTPVRPAERKLKNLPPPRTPPAAVVRNGQGTRRVTLAPIRNGHVAEPVETDPLLLVGSEPDTHVMAEEDGAFVPDRADTGDEASVAESAKQSVRFGTDDGHHHDHDDSDAGSVDGPNQPNSNPRGEFRRLASRHVPAGDEVNPTVTADSVPDWDPGAAERAAASTSEEEDMAEALALTINKRKTEELDELEIQRITALFKRVGGLGTLTEEQFAEWLKDATPEEQKQLRRPTIMRGGTWAHVVDTATRYVREKEVEIPPPPI